MIIEFDWGELYHFTNQWQSDPMVVVDVVDEHIAVLGMAIIKKLLA